MANPFVPELYGRCSISEDMRDGPHYHIEEKLRDLSHIITFIMVIRKLIGLATLNKPVT